MMEEAKLWRREIVFFIFHFSHLCELVDGNDVTSGDACSVYYRIE